MGPVEERLRPRRREAVGRACLRSLPYLIVAVGFSFGVDGGRNQLQVWLIGIPALFLGAALFVAEYLAFKAGTVILTPDVLVSRRLRIPWANIAELRTVTRFGLSRILLVVRMSGSTRVRRRYLDFPWRVIGQRRDLFEQDAQRIFDFYAQTKSMP